MDIDYVMTNRRRESPSTAPPSIEIPTLGSSLGLIFPSFTTNFPLFYLLQCGLLKGQPGRRVVAILEIRPLDHHY